MAGNVSFSVNVRVKNGGVLPELQARLRDLSPAFTAFIEEWARLNKQKFSDSSGKEMTGATVDDLVFWEALKGPTSQAKRRKGQPDWIMVATGDLMQALTDPDLIFERVEAEEAVFGTPLNLEEARKVQFNWSSRQAIFLSTIDQNALRRILKDYLQMGPDFQEMRASMATQTWRDAQLAQMDADFENDTENPDF